MPRLRSKIRKISLILKVAQNKRHYRIQHTKYTLVDFKIALGQTGHLRGGKRVSEFFLGGRNTFFGLPATNIYRKKNVLNCTTFAYAESYGIINYHLSTEITDTGNFLQPERWKIDYNAFTSADTHDPILYSSVPCVLCR